MQTRVRSVALACSATILLAWPHTGCSSRSTSADQAPPVAVAPIAAQTPAVAPPTRPVLTSQSPIGQTVVAAIDQNADPCQDFYRFACGSWLDATELPADKPSYGRGFTEVRDRNAKSINTLLAASAGQGGDIGKAGDFFTACMDQAQVEADSAKALDAALAGVDGVTNMNALARFLARGHGRTLGSAVFGAGRTNDFLDPDLYILGIEQGGLGLPDRSYYLEESRKPLLDFYGQHLARLLGFAGVPASETTQRAAAVVAFETELARAATPRDQLRDPEKVYNRHTRDELIQRSPGFPWKTYFKALGIAKIDQINVSVPGYVESFPGIVQATSMATVRDYLRTRVVDNSAAFLAKEIVDADFAMQAKLKGARQLRPRWERCVDTTTSAFPDAVARAYVDQHFAGASRDTALAMIRDIETAFAAGLPGLEWMDDATRAQAMEKMKAIANKIGYPNKWRDYGKVKLGKGYFASMQSAANYQWQHELAQIGQRVDPDEWEIPASMVNAFYNPLQNEMMFPSGILQPPFFSQEFPKAMNYGGVGMAMGHELTHGFDDSGRKFDGDGVMRTWWAPEASQRFEARAQCIEDAYSAVEIQPGVKINGKLTLGENIADFGGMKLTAAAYRNHVATHGPEAQLIEGMTNEQLLFVAFGQAWCTKVSPEYARFLVTVDPHSPPEQRVNLTLSHLPAFSQAFSCGENTPMHAANSCEVW